jgi:amidophosphoribosyltransferase
MDTENLIHLIAKSEETKLTDRIIDAIKKSEGAFSFVFSSRTKMYAARDPHGFRPLSLGKFKNGGYTVASETCAFDLIDAEFIRDILPGEMLIFRDDQEPESIIISDPQPYHCIFEYIYFARPDSNVFGKNVYQLRKNMGIELAREKPIEADMIVPVPDGGVPAAIGYAQESGIPYEMAIMRNHYVGRTFIEPTQEIRDLKVKMKLSPITDIIKGKRLIVIDDSIVRGTTSRKIVRMLKNAGALEVHMRISSPPTTDPCYYGVDTPDKDQLIASKMNLENICEYIGADSLAYLSNEGLYRSVGKDDNYCTACFTGDYIV